MTDETFAEVIVVLEAAYGQDFSLEKRRAWRLLIGDLPDEAARKAAIYLCRTSSYPPKPADIVKVVLGDPRDAERMLGEEAQIQRMDWEPQFSDCEYVDYGPIRNAVVQALGVERIATWMAREEWKYHTDEWEALYKHFRRHGEGGPPPIPTAVVDSVQQGFSLPPLKIATLPAMLPILGLPALPGRPALPSEVKVDGESRGSELAVSSHREGGDAE